MMKRYFSRGPQGKGDLGKRPKEDKGDGKEKDDDFPIVNNWFMICGGLMAYDSRHQRKLEHREVYAAELATPAFLNWFGSAITLDRDDHSDRIPQLGQYPFVVDPIIDNTRLTKGTDGWGQRPQHHVPRPLTLRGLARPSSARAEHLSMASY
jgi:hypothetical protein